MSLAGKKGYCCVCEQWKDIAKTIPSRGKFCKKCNQDRLIQEAKDAPKPVVNIRVQPVRWKRKETGEARMFEEIWNDRPRLSFVSGKPLGVEAESWFFAHVLPKSTYKKFRLKEFNIVLLTREEHTLWDNGDRDKLRQLPEWQKMFALEEELKDLYNTVYRNE